MAGEGTLEEVTILDLEEREGGRQAGETRRQEAAHLCIHCATVFLEDLLCVAAIGVDTVPAIADGAGDGRADTLTCGYLVGKHASKKNKTR